MAGGCVTLLEITPESGKSGSVGFRREDRPVRVVFPDAGKQPHPVAVLQRARPFEIQIGERR